MIAEITPTAMGLVDFVGCVGFFAVTGLVCKQLFFGDKQQKRLVSFDEQFATKGELNDLRAHVDRIEEKIDRAAEGIRTEMKADRNSILAAGEDRAVRIHEQIEVLLKAVFEVKGKVENRNER